MQKRWTLVYDHYYGLIKKAINTVSAQVSGMLNYVLPVKKTDAITQEELCSNIIVVGLTDNAVINKLITDGNMEKPDRAEGYSIAVMANPNQKDCNLIAIAGYDEKGVLYGAVDFCNKYLNDVLYKDGDVWSESFFDTLLEKKLPEYQLKTAPAIKTRALWTWGHVIYDYKNYFENMLKLRLNEVVIWNDFVPLNAKDVVDYAHSLGIKVVWGFAWGWVVKCEDFLNGFNDQTLNQIKKTVLNTYRTQYADTGADGIYFQSFTELNKDVVGGKCVAELVTELVNDISDQLFKENPILHIQFGLHATSVKTKLDYIKKVDPRVYIVWEDCGAFPFNYYSDRVDDFTETFALTENLISLRGKTERYGAVLKGMLKLDWNTFEHFSAPYILGERTDEYMSERKVWKNKIWKILQSGWIKNADCVAKTVVLISQNPNSIVQALVEDGVFEKSVAFPVAVYAEAIWDPSVNPLQILERVSKYPFVKFAD